jgi:transcriptional regulator with PAS, ATPase and Fis domain
MSSMPTAHREPFHSTDIAAPRVLSVRALRSSCDEDHDQVNDQLSVRLLGQSGAMRALRKTIRSLAGFSETVLISGESGTGKEVIARALHDLSRRRNKPFLAVNCGALTDSLLESELFGHVKGAFTGAATNKKGFFEAASGGSIFLDEFAEMSLTTQQRLLRVLQERTVRPVGSTDPKEIEVDTRVVVATNHDLKRDVLEHRFRNDLYYRVNILEIHSPALRERLEDVLPLAQHFIRKHNAKHGCEVSELIPSNVLSILKAYSWPGNVRELENIIKRLAVRVSDGRAISEADTRGVSELSPVLKANANYSEISTKRDQNSTGCRYLPAIEISRHRCACCEEFELYRQQMAEVGGNVTAAARQLRIPRSTLQRRLKKLRACSSLTA